MATLWDDFKDMDVRGANSRRGDLLLAGGEGMIEMMKTFRNPLRLMIPGMTWVSEYRRMRSFARRLKHYNDHWDETSKKDKRDVVASLRKTAKVAKISVMVLRWIVQWG